MQKIYVSSWLGIDFKTLPIELSAKKLADASFYEAFYKNFFSEVSSFNEIEDPEYVPRKEILLNHLIRLTSNKKKILSIGCGLGFLEIELAKKNNSLDITAIDPGCASEFLEHSDINVLKGTFPDVLCKNSRPFDFVYASSIDYAFSNKEYEDFLKSVIDFGIEEIFLLDLYPPTTSYISKIKILIKELLISLGLYNPGQFWGYSRTLKEHMKISRKAGFSVFKAGQNAHSYWLNCKV